MTVTHAWGRVKGLASKTSCRRKMSSKRTKKAVFKKSIRKARAAKKARFSESTIKVGLPKSIKIASLLTHPVNVSGFL